MAERIDLDKKAAWQYIRLSLLYNDLCTCAINSVYIYISMHCMDLMMNAVTKCKNWRMCVIAKSTRYKNLSCYNIEGKKEFTFIQNRTSLTQEKKPNVIHTETRAPVEESIETPLYKWYQWQNGEGATMRWMLVSNQKWTTVNKTTNTRKGSSSKSHSRGENNL